MVGKISIKKPNICTCYIKVNGEITNLGTFNSRKVVELPYGKYRVNLGVEYSDPNSSFMDHGRSQWSDMEWAWGEDKEIVVSNSSVSIRLKRKWHLLSHITAEALIIK